MQVAVKKKLNWTLMLVGLLIWLASIILPILAHGQITPLYNYQIQLRSAVVATKSANITGTGAQFHNLTWNVLGSFSACSVRVDSSADGITWNTGDIIAAQTCTSPGTIQSTSHVVNFVRINFVSKTGTGTLVALLNGYPFDFSGGGGGGAPGGNAGDVQVNDGLGGFTGDDSFKYTTGAADVLIPGGAHLKQISGSDANYVFTNSFTMNDAAVNVTLELQKGSLAHVGASASNGTTGSSAWHLYGYPVTLHSRSFVSGAFDVGVTSTIDGLIIDPVHNTPFAWGLTMAPVTTADLQPCNDVTGVYIGQFQTVTDLASTVYGAVAAGGGSGVGQIWCDGVNWHVVSGTSPVSANTVTASGTLTNTQLICGTGSKTEAVCNLSGDITTSGSAVTTLATVNSNVGTFNGITVNGKGLVTAAIAVNPTTTSSCAQNGTNASPSVVSCAAAAAGSFSCAVAASGGTCTVNTTAVTTNSTIIVVPNSAKGSILGSITCNTTPTVMPAIPVATQTNGTGFSLNLPTYTVNQMCFDYVVVN